MDTYGLGTTVHTGTVSPASEPFLALQAAGVGFEPTDEVAPRLRFSRPVRSAAPPPRRPVEDSGQGGPPDRGSRAAGGGDARAPAGRAPAPRRVEGPRGEPAPGRQAGAH